MKRVVPRIELAHPQLPPARLVEATCWGCEMRFMAMSEAGIDEAMRDHCRYVVETMDSQSDPHFQDIRLDLLCE